MLLFDEEVIFGCFEFSRSFWFSFLKGKRRMIIFCRIDFYVLILLILFFMFIWKK